jgi:hypothetical protein
MPTSAAKSTDVRIVDVVTDTEYIKYRMPIKFGGRVVTDVLLLNVTVQVETRDGRRGKGFGSMPMAYRQIEHRANPRCHDRLRSPGGQRRRRLHRLRTSPGDYP